MWVSKQTLKDMQQDIKDLRTNVSCLRGFHIWGLTQQSGVPFIRCNHCYTPHPSQKTTATIPGVE